MYILSQTETIKGNVNICRQNFCQLSSWLQSSSHMVLGTSQGLTTPCSLVKKKTTAQYTCRRKSQWKTNTGRDLLGLLTNLLLFMFRKCVPTSGDTASGLRFVITATLLDPARKGVYFENDYLTETKESSLYFLEDSV